MPRFTSKIAPDVDKLRGGYYTPDAIARALAAWVAAAGPRLLEPAAGDGVILRHLVAEAGPADVLGVELEPDEARRAGEHGDVVQDDFFRWFDEAQHGRRDGVAGNPPYIRFGNWSETERERALRFMRQQGLPTTKLMNAWMPFVAASVVAVREGGRVGLVLPAELLQVGYAKALRAYLVDNCAEITLISFRKLVFPGILQEVVLLLATRGEGPAVMRGVEVHDAADLGDLDLGAVPAVVAPLHDSEKWTKYYLAADEIVGLRSMREDPRLTTVGAWASVDVGVVTGRNSFFTMTAGEAAALGLYELTKGLVSRSAQLTGVAFTSADLDEQAATAARTRLLDVPPDVTPENHTGLRQHIAEGEAEEVHRGYKCRIRREWWRVPSTGSPDGFMLRQIHRYPRIFANHTDATSTDTVHRVTLRRLDATAAQLAVAALNSVTFASAEVVGRSYGGGILELEPSEAEHMPIPSPALVDEALTTKVDELLREGRTDDAVELVDQALLIDALGFARDQVQSARSAWVRLRDRRGGRGRSSRSATEA
ncbi:N-6 DNA Methylase [Geodermatophilus pulveris]|uniref:site-specific DNA-methyltransferase (adenine-specific) n=1 Tax=Geodermatophilus pulveris TaxID=1564159 RepID=A0A239HFW4_9ACTN|nr:class I SAM-dependent methyltransferase [Geodermatophilus pulveris]SNS79154.1 N-6 DNA Methylase [Geodermatophilus pulveris]